MEQLLANGVCTAAVYSLVAVGFGLIFFAARTFHIAHGAVYTTAGFVTYGALIPLGWPLVPSVLVGLAAGAVLGVLIEFGVYYPLIDPRQGRKASAAIVMMSSLGTYIVVVNAIAMIAGNDTKVLRPGVGKTVRIAGTILTHVQVAQLISAVLVIVLLALILRWTHFGRIVRALADDPELVGIMGHNVRLIRLGVMVVGSLLAGASSILVALDVGVDPQVGFNVLLIAAVATIVGGFGRLLAPALGALILGLLQSIVVWQTSQKWASVVVFAVLILVLLARPQGILASAKRMEEA
jgi:branched-chain amino acid transport system permease protein